MSTVGTKFTNEMLIDIPVTDIHVHLPGIISPAVAWELGVRNGFITITIGQNQKVWHNGPKSLSINNPHEHYSDIFQNANDDKILFDNNYKPIDLAYHIEHRSFKDFDRVMATVQGHRFPPGGIQNEDDIRLIFDSYLKEAIENKIFYTELQQNIKIAHNIYYNKKPKEARKCFFLLLNSIRQNFEAHGVHIRFLNCFNKTKAAQSNLSTHERALEAVDWLIEAQEVAHGLFVGIESAGHEKDPAGWPIHLKAGYEKAKALGFGCEAHGGEGIGSEHLSDIIDTLELSRIAHGFQMIEDLEVISKIKKKGITVCISPIINLMLGACIHLKDNIPTKKSDGGIAEYIEHIHLHPIFKLLREHHCKIALCSDNPHLGGVGIKSVIKILTGLSEAYKFPDEILPLTAEEVVEMSINSINAAFCHDVIKSQYKAKLSQFINKYNIKTEV